MAISGMAIARCDRCNVISLPMETHEYATTATVVLPEGWMRAWWFFADEGDDNPRKALLCPHCAEEACDWLAQRPERLPSNHGKCNAPIGWGNEMGFCILPNGHPLPHVREGV